MACSFQPCVQLLCQYMLACTTPAQVSKLPYLSTNLFALIFLYAFGFYWTVASAVASTASKLMQYRDKLAVKFQLLLISGSMRLITRTWTRFQLKCSPDLVELIKSELLYYEDHDVLYATQLVSIFQAIHPRFF